MRNELNPLTVEVPTTQVVTTIKQNRDAHRAIFDQALDGYRIAMIADLEERIDQVRKGKQIDKYLRLPEPEDHTKDYDRIIAMLELHVGDTIDLTEGDFARYVRDEWDWKDQFIGTASNYTSV